MKHLATLTALRAFEAMIRCGGVNQAAGDLHVTPGAISQQLRRLERDFGRRLFERTGRSLTPVAGARELAEELTAAFTTIAEAAARFAQGAEGGPLRIATLTSVATRLIVPALAQLRRQAPALRISFTYVHRPAEATFADADLLVTAIDGPYRGPGEARPLLPGAVRPVCSPTYRRRLGRAPTAAEIAQADLLHDGDLTGWLRWFRAAGLRRRTAAGDIYEDVGLLAAAALSGQGIALCPPSLFGPELAKGDLVAVSDIATLQERQYCLVLPDRPRAEALVFADWARSLTR